jgi:hypothetical protein
MDWQREGTEEARDLAHANAMLSGRLAAVLEYSHDDLVRLSETLLAYAMGRRLMAPPGRRAV